MKGIQSTKRIHREDLADLELSILIVVLWFPAEYSYHLLLPIPTLLANCSASVLCSGSWGTVCIQVSLWDNQCKLWDASYTRSAMCWNWQLWH